MKLKSGRSEEKVYLRFVNRTSRQVDILWVDYEGEPVKYGGPLEPNAFFDVTSYLNHPWMFQDSKTKDNLAVNGDFVFLPPSLKKSWALIRRRYPNSDENLILHRIVVFITLPVYSLRECCLQVVRDSIHFTNSSQLIRELELPKSVQDDLINKLEIKSSNSL